MRILDSEQFVRHNILNFSGALTLILCCLGFSLGFSIGLSDSAVASDPPNIVFILADDLGYGDVQCLNPERGKIPTPNMDQVAAQGMTFHDAHTTSSVCTPTRYSIMTGRYNWRTKLQKSVLNGYGESLIAEDRMTVASLLKSQGYTTAMIGKWHLGLGIPTTDGKKAKPKSNEILKPLLKTKQAYDPSKLSNIDWEGTIEGGPVDLGFDTWYGISASLDFPPYVWIRNRNFVGKGTHVKAFHRLGPASEDFEAIEVLDKLAAETVKYISDYDSDKPFFIYMPLPSPHTPILPTEKWQGKSGLGNYGDFVMQTDDVVGQVVKALEAKGISENTLLIVTSDNGCSKRADFKNLESHGHFASAQFRGSKSDIWDGGHRVPFFVKWPKVISSGSVSDDLVCQMDFLATCGEMLNAPIPENAAEDSESILPIFYGKPPQFTRNGLIHHSVSGHFSYRQGNHKLILARGSGGWTAPGEKAAAAQNLPEAQLYDMAADPGEQNNMYLSKPDLAQQLLVQLTTEVETGSTVAGKSSKNDVENIKLWKSKRSK